MQIQIEWIEIVWTGWTFELDYYFFFMWLPEKHLLFFSSRHFLYPTKSQIHLFFQKNQSKTGNFCIVHRKLELNSKNNSMTVSILEGDNFQWHLRQDTVTSQMQFSQHFNHFPECSLTNILAQLCFSDSSLMNRPYQVNKGKTCFIFQTFYLYFSNNVNPQFLDCTETEDSFLRIHIAGILGCYGFYWPSPWKTPFSH